MALDWSPLVALLQKSQEPLLMTHMRPDPDGLGSQLGLAEGLRQLGKKPRVVIASPLPPRYQFLDPTRELIEPFQPPGDAFAQTDAIVVLDTGTWNQLGDFGPYMRSRDVPKAVVDHHRTQDDLGGLQLVDTTAEATGRLAYELLQALGAPLTPLAASHLFIALATDTGWFRHSNTSAATFELAAELRRLGANPTAMYERLYEAATMPRLRLTGVALERLQTRADGQIAFTEIYLKDYETTGAVPGDTEDLINYPRSVEGVEVALVFIEQPEGGTKISFRSRSKVDVSKVAEHFQGGGHKLASGARDSRDLPTAREAVLAVVEEALRTA